MLIINTISEYISSNWIGILSTLIGLVYLFYEYKASILMWPASICMAILYIYIFYTTQLYASMLIYGYFLLASVYGWLAWIKHNEGNLGEHIIYNAPKKLLLPIIAILLVIFAIITIGLLYLTNNTLTVILGDSITTTLSIVALWMASKKWAEQWLLLIPANLILCILLLIQKEQISSILFFVYFIVSIFGYFKWKKLATQ